MDEARSVVVTGGGTGIGPATAADLGRDDSFPHGAGFVECDVSTAEPLVPNFYLAS